MYCIRRRVLQRQLGILTPNRFTAILRTKNESPLDFGSGEVDGGMELPSPQINILFNICVRRLHPASEDRSMLDEDVAGADAVHVQQAIEFCFARFDGPTNRGIP